MGSDVSDRTEIERLEQQLDELQVKLGAAKQAESRDLEAAEDSGIAAEKRAVKVDGSNLGNLNAGTQTNINTAGGAVIDGRVETRGGHFIGRDFIQIVTEVVHKGNDPDEAQSVIAHYLQALAVDLAGLKLNAI